MKKMLRASTLPAALIASFATIPAVADTYIIVEGTSLGVESNLDAGQSALGLRYRIGRHIGNNTPVGKNLDMEVHLAFGMDGLTSSNNELLFSFTGFFLKGYFPLGYNSTFYALGGYTEISLSQTVNGRESKYDPEGLSYGAGFETRISNSVDLTLDYVRYVTGEDLIEDISTVSLGLKFNL